MKPKICPQCGKETYIKRGRSACWPCRQAQLQAEIDAQRKPDPRVAELEVLAREEGIKLPMPADLILYIEDSGRVVDLVSGDIYDAVIATPERHAQAVSYLLSAY